MILPGTSIKIPPSHLEGLGIELSRVIDDLENLYSSYFDDISIWWKWYEAVPRISGPKNWPFQGASNIVVPLIQIMSDALVNRVYAGIFGHGRRIWLARTENDDEEKIANNVVRGINWAGNNNDFNFRLSSYDQLLEALVIGSSVQGINWRQDVRFVYDPASLRGRGKPRAVKVEVGRGVITEHIPREQILWDTRFLIQEAPVVVRQLFYPWSKLNQLTKLDDSWNKENIASIQGRGGNRSPSQIVQRDKDIRDSRMGADPNDRFTHDIREIHIDFPMVSQMGFKMNQEDPGIPSPPLVATLDRNSKKILRLISEPYNLPYKPFFDVFYRKRSGRGHSVGIAKKLSHMQTGMTVSVNQALDARTRANSVWAKTTRRDLLNRPIDIAQPIFVNDMGEFEPFDLHTATFDDMRLLTALQTIAERQVGQADPALGRETRQGGHPSPATSTLALLEQSDLMSGTTRELIRMQFSRIGEAAAILYQQNETNEDGRLQRIFGEKDAAQIESFLDPGVHLSQTGIQFDLVGMSEAFNPDTEMRRALLVSQMNTNYWAFLLRAFQVVANPQFPPLIKQAALKSIEAQTKAHERFLEAGDVDDLERFVFNLNQTNQQPQQALGIAREIAGARVGAEEQPGLAGAQGAAGAGAAGQPGVVGAFG